MKFTIASIIAALAVAVNADCAGHATGSYWTGISDPSKGGCAWYYCQGNDIVKWIDCGRGACSNGPGCA